MVALSKTILAIAPGNRYLGVAVYSRGELVYFGVKGFCGKKTKRILLPQAGACIGTNRVLMLCAVPLCEECYGTGQCQTGRPQL